MDEGDDLLHVVAREAAGGEGGRAQPDTARVHRRLVARHRVLFHASVAAGASIAFSILLFIFLIQKTSDSFSVANPHHIINADQDADLGYQNDADLCGSGCTTLGSLA